MKNKIVCSISLVLVLLIFTAGIGTTVTIKPTKLVFAQTEQVIIKALLDNLADPGRWEGLIQPALKILNERYHELHINVTYSETPYNETRIKILDALSNQTPLDLVSVDQIGLGEFAEKGLLTDLTNRTEKWGRSSDWYQANWD